MAQEKPGSLPKCLFPPQIHERLFATVEDAGSGLVAAEPGSFANSRHSEPVDTTSESVLTNGSASSLEPDVADKDKADQDGTTALQRAREGEHPELVRLLAEWEPEAARKRRRLDT